MSEHVEAIESAASSSVGSIAIKTAAVGGSLDVPSRLPIPDVQPWMQTHILGSLSPGDICQLAGTAYIIGLVIVALVRKYKAFKKLNKKLYNSTIMGGSGGDGP
jgi:hypothetical protein